MPWRLWIVSFGVVCGLRRRYMVRPWSSSFGLSCLSVLMAIRSSCVSRMVFCWVGVASSQAVLFRPMIMSCGRSSRILSGDFVMSASCRYSSWSGFMLYFHISIMLTPFMVFLPWWYLLIRSWSWV